MTRLVAGRYELIRTLGAGGQGTVHLAADLETEQPVALKRWHVGPPPSTTPRTLDALPSHPGIVRMLGEVGSTGDRWLVMEWVEGEDLASRVERDGALPTYEALEAGAQIADALAHLHHHGVFHGDVKPSNVITATDGRAVLVDLGSLGEPNRSVAFSPPEPGTVGSSAGDVWSLAATVIHLLVGSPPAFGQAVAWPADLAPTVVATLTRALDLDRDRRPSAHHVGQAVRAASDARSGARVTVDAPTLVGRDAELCRLSRALGQGLVTITGPAGVGKSALAREVARAAMSSGDLIWIEGDELGSVADLRRLLVAGAGLEPGARDLPTLIDALRSRKVMIVIDGVGASGPELRRELEDCQLDGLTIVMTSPGPLGVSDEVVVEVAPLAVPDADSPGGVIASAASRLLLQRCRERGTIGMLDAEAAAVVAGAARAADGIPLALELAASDLRTAGTHLLVSLHHAFTRLPEHLRLVIGALSVFRGSFTVEDATGVLDGAISPSGQDWGGVLADLRARSLLTEDSPERYRVPRAVKDLASDAVEGAERVAARRAHASWVQELIARLAEDDNGLRSPRGAVEVPRRRRDLLTAVDTLLREQPDAGCALLLSLAAALVDHGPGPEVERLFEDAQRQQPGVGMFPIWRARIAQHQGRLDDSLALIEVARSIGDGDGDGDATWRMIHRVTGHVHADRMDWTAAEAAYRAGLGSARRQGDPAMVSLHLVDVASVLAVDGREAGAEALLHEAVTLAQEAETPYGLVQALVQLATVMPDRATDTATRGSRPGTCVEALGAAAAVAQRVASDALVALSYPSLAMAQLRLIEEVCPDRAAVRRAVEVAEEGRRASLSTATARGLGLSELALALAAEFDERLDDEAEHLRRVRQVVGRPELRPHLWVAYLAAVGLYACRRSQYDQAQRLLALVDEHRRTLGQTSRPDALYWDRTLRRRLAGAGRQPLVRGCRDEPDGVATAVLQTEDV